MILTVKDSKKIFNGLKDGIVYGLFNDKTSKTTFRRFYMDKSGNIRIVNYGQYTILGNIEALENWLTWETIKDNYIKPVTMLRDYVTYAEI